MVKICEICGEEFEAGSNVAKYCSRPCADEGARRINNKRDQRKAKTRRCPTCGIIHTGKSKYCCEHCKKTETASVYKEPKPPRISKIDEINTAARAAGMSYGKYQAMINGSLRDKAR